MTDVNDIYVHLIRDGEGEEIAEEILRKNAASHWHASRLDNCRYKQTKGSGGKMICFAIDCVREKFKEKE